MLQLILSLVGIMLALPSALVSWRDYREGRLAHASAGQNAKIYSPTRPSGEHPASERSTIAGRSLKRLSAPRRFLSYLIDVYVIFAGVVVVAVALGGGDPAVEEAIAGLLFIASPFVMAWANSASGRSLGKLLVGGRLVRADADTINDQPTYLQALLRLALSAILNALLYLSIFASLARDDRRTLHDLATNTRVVQTR